MRSVDIEPSEGADILIANKSEEQPKVSPKYHYIWVPDDPQEVKRFQNKALPLYNRDLHGDNITAVLRLIRKITPGAILGFAEVGKKDIGFTAFHLHNIEDEGWLVASVDATVVNRQFQRQGIAQQFAWDIMTGEAGQQAEVEEEKQGIPDVLTARNSTPWPLTAKLKTGFIDRYYPNETQLFFPHAVTKALIQINGDEIFDEDGKLIFNPTTGLWKDVHGFEHGQRLEIDPQEHPLAASIYNFWIEKVGMDPENNDAVQSWIKVAKGKLRDHLRTQEILRANGL